VPLGAQEAEVGEVEVFFLACQDLLLLLVAHEENFFGDVLGIGLAGREGGRGRKEGGRGRKWEEEKGRGRKRKEGGKKEGEEEEGRGKKEEGGREGIGSSSSMNRGRRKKRDEG
jgi:hypothetical protein